MTRPYLLYIFNSTVPPTARAKSVRCGMNRPAFLTRSYLHFQIPLISNCNGTLKRGTLPAEADF
nr:MAG TPA: hypothetical protein [Caudoviricetes sp.]